MKDRGIKAAAAASEMWKYKCFSLTFYSFPSRSFTFKVHCCCFYCPCPALPFTAILLPSGIQSLSPYISSIPFSHTNPHFLLQHSNYPQISDGTPKPIAPSDTSREDPAKQKPLHRWLKVIAVCRVVFRFMVRPPFHRSSWHTSFPLHNQLQTPSLNHHIVDSCRSTVFQIHSLHNQRNPICAHPHSHSIPIVLYCALLAHRSHNKGPLPCLYFPTKTASEMYRLCFWAWPRPKATPRPNIQPLTSSPPKVSREAVSTKMKVSALDGKKRNKALGVVFGQGIIYILCFSLSNSVSFFLSVGHQEDFHLGI